MKTFIIVFFLAVLFSCSDKFKEKVSKNWSVYKMQKIISVTSNNYVPINVKISSNMSYHFQSNSKVSLITQTGSKIKGFWNINDSIISITIKKEIKKLKIIKLTDDELVLTSGKFKFYLEN